MKILLKECDILAKNADFARVEAAVDVFCRIGKLRDSCASFPLASLLLACVRCIWLCILLHLRCTHPAIFIGRFATELCRHAATAGEHAAMSRFLASARGLLCVATDPSLVRPKIRGGMRRPVAYTPRQATTAQRATSALQMLQRARDAAGPRAGREPADDETRAVMEPKDDEQDLEPDDYDASSDDADDAAYCMQPAV